MAVTKVNGFAAPYRSLTFQQQAQALCQGNGLLSMSGTVAPDGGVNIIIPPFAVVLQGLLVNNSQPTTVALPSTLAAPYFVTVSCPTSQQTNDLIYRFAKAPQDFSGTEAVLAYYDGTEWHAVPRVSTGGLLSGREADAVDELKTGPKTGLGTTKVSSNYVNGIGVLVDRLGRKTKFLDTFTTPTVATDPDWPRVDRMIYRKPDDTTNRIGVRELVVGNTFATSGSLKLHDTSLASSSIVHSTVRALTASDNTAHFLYMEGYGNTFTLKYQKYSSDRATQLVGAATIASATTSSFSAVIDGSDHIHIAYVSSGHIKWVKISNVGATLSGPTTVDAQTATCSAPSIGVDPNNTAVFFVYQVQLSPPNSQLFLTTRDLSGNLITSDTQLTTGSSNIISPSIVVTDDMLVHIAYENNSTHQIFYTVRNNIGGVVSAAINVSNNTSYQGSLLTDVAQKPRMRVADNKQPFVFFLQDKGTGDYGVSIYAYGAASQIDIIGPTENFVDYSPVIDPIRNDVFVNLVQVAQVDYAQLDTTGLIPAAGFDPAATFVQAISINVSGGDACNLTRDKFGSLLHIWSLPLTGTFTNAGGSVNVGYIGPVAVAGSQNTLTLSSSQFSILAAGLSYIPIVGDQATVSGSTHGNNGAYNITAVSLQSINGTNDTYVITVGTPFAATESPATGDHVQFATQNGNDVRFAKTVAESTQARALQTTVPSTDVLLSRIYMPGNTILNYVPDGFIAPNSGIWGVYGDATIDWSATSASKLTISTNITIIDLSTNTLYTVAAGSYSMSEGDALYVPLNGTAGTVTPVDTPIQLLPYGAPIGVLGYVKNGEFRPHLLALANVPDLPSGEAVVIGVELTSQNQTMRLINGGNWSYNNSTGTLSWSANANVSIPGLADSVNVITAGSVVLTDGQVAKINLNRSGVGGSLTVSAVAVASYVQSDNSAIFARRVGSIVYVGLNTGAMVLNDGESKALFQNGYLTTSTATAGQSLTARQAVYISTGADGRTAGDSYPVDATNDNRVNFFGFVPAAVSNGVSGLIVNSGLVPGFSSLTPGALYYIDPTTPGAITSTKPTTSGQWIIPVGIAVSSTTLLVNAALGGTAQKIALTTAYPNVFVQSESDLASAITTVTGLGGGVICLAGAFTISASYTIPSGALLLGRMGGTVVTVLSGGSITLSDGASMRDVFMTTALTSGSLLNLSNNYATVRGCQFTIPTNSTGQCINVTGNANKMFSNIFVGVQGSDTGYAINYASGVDNADTDSVFLP